MMKDLISVNYSTKGNILRVSLEDNTFKKFHKDKADINNEKDMNRLFDTLKNKGVKFPSEFLLRLTKDLKERGVKLPEKFL